MALPTILIDSATGSDTQASGAGPATALFGTTNASTSGDGLTVTLPAGTDLSGVATDGSHVIFLNNSTAGNRNFGKITGTAGSGGATPTVTVSNAFGLSLSNQSWAIGGRRASIGSTTSKKLVDNNGSAGDWRAGWAIEFQSGHAETITATMDLRGVPDTTDGPMYFRGAADALTTPVLTFSNNGYALVSRCNDTTNNSGVEISDLELRNTNATKTASVGIAQGSSGCVSARRVRIDHATDKFWKGIFISSAGGKAQIESCRIGNAASHGIDYDTNLHRIFNCEIYACGGAGINGAGVVWPPITGNIVRDNTGDGINVSIPSDTASSAASIITHNTVTGNGGDGIEIVGNTARQLHALLIANNDLGGNGGYAIRWNASTTLAHLQLRGVRFFGNNHHGNTSGLSNLTGFDEYTTNLDPQYRDTGSGDYAVGPNLKGKGFPVGGSQTVGHYGSTRSYVDPGAAQRQEFSARARSIIGL